MSQTLRINLQSFTLSSTAKSICVVAWSGAAIISTNYQNSSSSSSNSKNISIAALENQKVLNVALNLDYGSTAYRYFKLGGIDLTGSGAAASLKTLLQSKIDASDFTLAETCGFQLLTYPQSAARTNALNAITAAGDAPGTYSGTATAASSISFSGYIDIEYEAKAAVSVPVTITGGGTFTFLTDVTSIAPSETMPLKLLCQPTVKIYGADVIISSAGIAAADTVEIRDIEVNAGASYTAAAVLTMSSALGTALLNRTGNTALVKVVIYTDSGCTQSLESAFTEASLLGLVKARVAPSFSAPTFTDENGYLATYGGFIQNKSDLSIAISTITLDTQADADITITSRTLDLGGVVYNLVENSENLGAVSVSGTVSYTLTITDSHGLSGTQSGTLTVFPYSSPVISALDVIRYVAKQTSGGETIYVADDDGVNVWLDLKGNVQAVNGLNGWELKYSIDGGSEVTADSGQDGCALNYVNDRARIQNTFAASQSYTVLIQLSDSFESTPVYSVEIPKAGAIFNIEHYGVAVGKRSSGTEEEPKFECAYDAEFAGEVKLPGTGGWIDLTLASGVSASSSEAGRPGGARYRVDGHMVTLEANLAFTQGSSAKQLTTTGGIPAEYTPTYRPQVFYSTSGTRIGRAYIVYSGDCCHLMSDWIRNISDGGAYTGATTWCDIHMQWWI